MAKGWKARFTRPPAARLFLLVAFDDLEVLGSVRPLLEKKFGRLDYETGSLPARERPSPYGLDARRLLRIFSFKRLVGRDELVDIRRVCSRLERKLARAGRPLVELEPGYVSASNVVLASLQEDLHRLYLYGGVFAEVLYYFERIGFQPLSYTPSFCRQKELKTAFNDIRMILQSQG